MSEERKLILNMLKEGKISDDEALKLLDAIKDKASDKQASFTNTEDRFEEKTKSFVTKILSGVENAMNKVGESLSNVEIDFSSFSTTSHGARVDNELKIEDIDGEYSLFVSNKNGRVQIQSWEEDYVLCQSVVSYDPKQLFGDEEFIIVNKLDNNYQIKLNDDINSNLFNAKYEIFIPSNDIVNLSVETTNGKIEALDIECKEIELKTTNGKIEASDIETTILQAHTTNSKVTLSDIIAESVDIKTTNGKIELSDIDSERVTAKNTNGSILFDSPSEDCKYISMQSTNGGLYIEDLNLDRPVKAVLKGRLSDEISDKFTRIDRNGHINTAYTSEYISNPTDVLEIELTTTNGKLVINE